ncbi:aminoglycoside phosphotransferase family protein [Thiomicrorhabdus sediminis]|uniref:Aminoglycoside phosphotransferase n=1 Tax=Thiomicrorhabdus sediminis TaxID=2580412 RepID=A0A4P9K5D6_9GAMM|nr:phosphotransferase [Thiomicrorhabdus sediminis]QCU89670.1 aminoglycoside phosphotransferase [Thiomicrorhabdus sediminis]
MDERFELMLQWLQQLSFFDGCELSKPVPASSDASFRRYFRVESQGADKSACGSFIIMDAPPEHENCEPFIKVSEQLNKMGLNVPKVLAKDLHKGFLLLGDLGSITYLNALHNSDESRADELYRQALQALVKLQSQAKNVAAQLPPYDAVLLDNEMNLFSDWLLAEHLQAPLAKNQQADWQQTKALLAQSALQQPKTYVHRDYHSRNLMVCQQDNPGILDFQDAVYGPLTYDAVSLLRDCYIAWPKEQVTEWQRYYFLELVQAGMLQQHDWQDFVKSMDLMGIQRHLKAAGIFARLYHRDGKDGYLNDIPQTLQYIVEVGSQYKELSWLVKLVENTMLPHPLLQQA